MSLPVDLLRHKLSVEDFHRMSAAGILREDSRIELIEGELVDMAPIGSLHASTVNRLAVLLARRVDPAVAGLSIQNPLSLPPHSQPVPDLMLLRPRPDAYASALPGVLDVLLLIEVSDSTPGHDRTVKRALYARHAVPEVWIVDAQARLILVHRQPTGSEYASCEQLDFDAPATPDAVPGLAVTAREIFADLTQRPSA